jgi:hypothetical protein
VIDWVKANLPLSEPLDLPHGRIVRISPDGEIEWDLRAWLEVPSSSGDTRIRLRASGDLLEVSGNPSKWLQGHNLWGSDDLVNLTVDMTLAALEALSVRPNPADEAGWRTGGFGVKLAHIAVMFDLGSDDAVMEYLRWLEGAPAANRRVHGILKGSTVSWTTRALRMKAYHKLQELLDTKQLANHDLRDELLAWASGKLRWEVELRSRELKRLRLDHAAFWMGVDATGVALAYAKLVEMPARQARRLAVLDLPAHLRGTYALWADGVDLRVALSRPTYYRHRKELLTYGVDISRPPTEEERLPVVALPPFPPLHELPVATPPADLVAKLRARTLS